MCTRTNTSILDLQPFIYSFMAETATRREKSTEVESILPWKPCLLMRPSLNSALSFGGGTLDHMFFAKEVMQEGGDESILCQDESSFES